MWYGVEIENENGHVTMTRFTKNMNYFCENVRAIVGKDVSLFASEEAREDHIRNELSRYPEAVVIA